MQFLVMARIAQGIPMDKVLPYIKPEAEKVWEYYQTDLIRSIHYITDMSGAVMMLEADNLESVRSAMDNLPMVQNQVLDIEIFPLKPYMGLETLFAT